MSPRIGLDSVETAGKRYRCPVPIQDPKILIPYTGDRARISIEVISKNPDVQIEELSLFVEDCPANCKIETAKRAYFIWFQTFNFSRRLHSSDIGCTHFSSERPRSRWDQRRIGIAVGDIVIAPVERHFPAGANFRPANASGKSSMPQRVICGG